MNIDPSYAISGKIIKMYVNHSSVWQYKSFVDVRTWRFLLEWGR